MARVLDGDEEKRVCVTGASGYIASWIVKLLLHRGYVVHATVRSLDDPRKTEHLRGLDGAKERLQLFKANLLEEGSFDSAVDGCCGVFHTASPVLIETPNPQEEYVLSKTLAETAAWKFAKENGIDMVSINPALVIGPMLQPVINWSSDVLFNMVNGKSETYLNASFGWVHVKDVAEAHIRAFEIPSANGRYILSETVAHFSQVVDILQELYPNLKLPHKCMDDQPFQSTYQLSKDKVIRSLGLEYIPLRVALKEAVDFLIEKKLINV